ncbi:hypothetical protein PT974_09770 [Cladobotryum mycophilum]|uniref:Uncharacterized protein n=1 Tax=Cladobotryum mycophilum TaxID=491253 RepID=A0ABR0SI23_9HYPO
MVYHALIKHTNSPYDFRYIVSVPDADAIDEWWRSVSGMKELGLKRLGPDFYSYGGADIGVLALTLRDRLVLTKAVSLDASQSIYVHQVRTDHVSGGCFYIRSKSSPELYWILDGTWVRATKEGRTRFRIAIADESDPKVMISSDKVSISLATDPTKYIVVGSKEQLYVGTSSSTMLFSYFKKNLLAESKLDTLGEGYVSYVKEVDEGVGEEWELVK